jgi:hypothetical protein
VQFSELRLLFPSPGRVQAPEYVEQNVSMVHYAPLRYSTPPGKEKSPTEEERIARVGEPRRPFIS